MFTSGAPVSDNTGSKCKIICRIKISARAGLRAGRQMQVEPAKIPFTGAPAALFTCRSGRQS
jgi:hypothetical protein